jgi:hypothetical protein
MNDLPEDEDRDSLRNIGLQRRSHTAGLLIKTLLHSVAVKASTLTTGSFKYYELVSKPKKIIVSIVFADDQVIISDNEWTTQKALHVLSIV